MKKIVKKTKIKKKIEITPSQFGMVLEDVNSKFDLLIEGFSGLSGQVENLDKKIDNNHQEFLEFRDEMVGFKQETDNNFKAVFEYLSKIDDEIQLIKLEIENLKSELVRKADIDKLSQLEKRIFVLEKGYRKFNFGISAR